MKRYLWFLLLFFGVLPLTALPKIGYAGMSAVLPGSSEILLEKPTRGGILIASDLLALFAWSSFGKDAKDLASSYKRYALAYAGVPINHNERYYQHIQTYLSSDDFNQYQEMMARNYFLIYGYDPEGFEQYLQDNLYHEGEQWHWQSTTHLQKYKSLRRDKQKAVMYQNLALGALLLNRAVSVVDALFLSSKAEKETPLPVFFSVSPENVLMVNYSLEF